MFFRKCIFFFFDSLNQFVSTVSGNDKQSEISREYNKYISLKVRNLARIVK